MQYASFFAVWLLSSLILGVVHGPAMGTFFGLAIATGYRLAVRKPVSHNPPAPSPYIGNRHRPA